LIRASSGANRSFHELRPTRRLIAFSATSQRGRRSKTFPAAEVDAAFVGEERSQLAEFQNGLEELTV
jgi:hypothetical protein